MQLSVDTGRTVTTMTEVLNHWVSGNDVVWHHSIGNKRKMKQYIGHPEVMDCQCGVSDARSWLESVGFPTEMHARWASQLQTPDDARVEMVGQEGGSGDSKPGAGQDECKQRF